MEREEPEQPKMKASDVADFILDAGVFLMSSGAHSGRVWRNCKRIARHWGYHININLGDHSELVDKGGTKPPPD